MSFEIKNSFLYHKVRNITLSYLFIGLYISDKNPFAPPEFYGLGVRVEDDILITECGPINLTESCPKEIAEIEALAK